MVGPGSLVGEIRLLLLIPCKRTDLGVDVDQDDRPESLLPAVLGGPEPRPSGRLQLVSGALVCRETSGVHAIIESAQEVASGSRIWDPVATQHS